MRNFFLIPLMTLFSCVMAWAGNKPAKAIEPVPFQFNEAAPAAKAAAPARMKADATEQDVLLKYGEVSQHFSDIQSAFNALPANSTPATVKLLTDQYVEYSEMNNCVTLQKYHNVTLDLNGKTLYGSTPINVASTAVISNNGTITIVDSSDDGSGNGTGKFFNEATNVDDWQAAGYPYPRYANNVISNRGTVIIESGYIENKSPGNAAYVVDMYDNSTLIVNGGHLYNYYTSAIRCFGSSNAAHTQNVTINNGLVEGYSAIWLQVPSKNTKPNINLTINGGEIRSTANAYANGTSDLHQVGSKLYNSRADGATYENIYVNITGGTINENILFGPTTNLTISGGRFNGRVETYGNTDLTGGIFDLNETSFYDQYTSGANATTMNKILSNYGFESQEAMEAAGYIIQTTSYGYIILVPSIWFRTWFLDNQLHSGYVFKHIGATEEDLLYKVVPATSVVVTENTTWNENTEDLSATVITVGDEDHKQTTVVVTDTVEVHGMTLAEESQLIVKDGAVLTVGNGGLVTDNDVLTQVIVEAGGTVVVGTGGINKQGDAVPVEVQSSGEKSGVLLIDPNAPATVAEAPAKVKVYTRAYIDNGGAIQHWQQMASPVKGDNITITRIVEDGQPAVVRTAMYKWDYPTDKWVRMTMGENTYFEDSWTTNDETLVPFAAYDLINNSNSTHGGITYEFAGELVGNGDMKLNFPKRGFCIFGNSYTAPIDLTTLFDQIQNDIQTNTDKNTYENQDNIDPCVYMFNSAKDRFESVNALALFLDKLGFEDAAFTQIPPQQAFVMNLLSGSSAQTAVDYVTSVWGNTQGDNVAIRAPKRVNNTISSMLNIVVEDGTSSDRIVLVENSEYSEGYDRGADAEKYMNANFNIYANAAGRNLAMVATDNMEGTELTFAAGNAVNYTMTFANVEGEYVLVDNLNNNQIAIAEGGTYTFAAQPKSTVAGRFAIIPMAKIPTAIENTEVKANVKGIYSITGMYLGEDFQALPAGVYVVDGVKIVK